MTKKFIQFQILPYLLAVRDGKIWLGWKKRSLNIEIIWTWKK